MLPTTYHLDIAEYPVPSLVKIVSSLLESIVEANDKLIATHDYHSTNITHFHSRAVPNISIYAYLTRISKFASFSNEVLLSLLVYFDRIAKLKKTEYAVNSLTVHRLLITSIVVASKFTSDVFYSNTRYAKVGGIPLYELNQLELEFLFLCNFDLHVKLEDMQAYGDQLLTHALTCNHKRKRRSSLSDEVTSINKIQKSEALLDKALISSKVVNTVNTSTNTTFLSNKLLSSHPTVI